MALVRPGQVALGVMCKVPRSGASKTRLCPPLAEDEAAALSACFIADVAAVIHALPPDLGAQGVAVYTPFGSEDGLDDLLPAGFGRLGQRGADLGERLLHATEDLLASGFEAVCLINSDSPTLPSALLHRVMASLRQPGDRVVIGPAIDGGYTLIGLKHPHPLLFRDITWSTGHVLAETLTRAASGGLSVSLLPLWYDVDDAASLQLLLEELFGNGIGLSAGEREPPPAARSRRYLSELLAGPLRAGLSFPSRSA